MDAGSLLSGFGAALVGLGTMYAAFGERGKKRRALLEKQPDPLGVVVRDLTERLEDEYDELVAQHAMLTLWVVALVRAAEATGQPVPPPPSGLRIPGLIA